MALAVCLFVTMEANAGDCIRASETGALEVRLVQTELMVAALSCQRKSDYNRFVRKFETELVARGQALKSLFQRLYGDRAEHRLNRFITRLANEASMRSLVGGGYCAGVAQLFEDAFEVAPGNLAAFAAHQPFSRKHGLPICGADSQLSDAFEPAGAGIAERKRQNAQRPEDKP